MTAFAGLAKTVLGRKSDATKDVIDHKPFPVRRETHDETDEPGRHTRPTGSQRGVYQGDDRHDPGQEGQQEERRRLQRLTKRSVTPPRVGGEKNRLRIKWSHKL